jgi:hypothetical protein
MVDTPQGESIYVCQQHRCLDHKDKRDQECDHAGCVLINYEPWMDQYSMTIVRSPVPPSQPGEPS